MIVNCGYHLKIGKVFYYKNKSNIELNCDLHDMPEVRKQLMKHKPDGRNWSITGHYVVGDRIIEEGLK